MRSFLIFLASALLSGGVIANAVFQKKQFYPSVVYISKSNPSMAVREIVKFILLMKVWIFVVFLQVIYFQSMILVLMMGKLMRKVSVDNDMRDDDINPCLSDILRNSACCWIWTFNGKILVCVDWDLLGVYSFQGRLQSQVHSVVHCSTISQIISLAGRRSCRLCECNVARLIFW